ncbi:MAG: hypothetical protein Q9170_005105 [Blastenia crenularia]
MADPLSIAAGVAGVLTAAAQISNLLIEFTKNSKNAPQTARIVLAEVSDISGTLAPLQSFLLGNESSDRSRTELLQIDQVITIMSGCVLTFSELEKLLDKLEADGKGILHRIQWAKKEKAIASLIQRLQNHKASLSLILQVLNGHAIVEAKDSVDRLHEMIERCYQEILSRMGSTERQEQRTRDGLSEMPCMEDDTSSILTLREANPRSTIPELSQNSDDDVSLAQPIAVAELEAGPWIPQKTFEMNATDGDLAATFNYMDALRKSWVYQRNNALDSSRLSVFSRDGCSMSWSCLSRASWAEISNISVVGLPIEIDELRNPLRSVQTWSIDYVTAASPGLSAVELPIGESVPLDMFTSKSPSCLLNYVGVELLAGESGPLDMFESDLQLDMLKLFDLECSDDDDSLVTKYTDCLRCHDCLWPLGPDADSLLLENEILIYKSCTYSCVTCGENVKGYAKLMAFHYSQPPEDPEDSSEISSVSSQGLPKAGTIRTNLAGDLKYCTNVQCAASMRPSLREIQPPGTLRHPKYTKLHDPN